MTIEALAKVLPPPAVPCEPFRGPWRPVEAELGTLLPTDYKEFARLYGGGYFMEFMGIDIPRYSNPNMRLELSCRVVSRSFSSDDDLPYPMWPQPGGLLSFGGTDNGDCLFWLRDGPPEEWRVVVWDRGLQTFEVIDRDLTGFLAGLITGEVLPAAFPEDLLPCDRLFIPNWAIRPGQP